MATARRRLPNNLASSSTWGRRLRLWAALFLVLLLALAAFVTVAYRNALAEPVVVRRTLALPGLPAGTRLTVALVSDTHYGKPDMPRPRLERLVDQVNGLGADLILLAGDYNGGKLDLGAGFGGDDRKLLEPALQPFARLRAPMGVYAVMGNHDPPYWTPWVLRRQRGPELLVNRWVDLGSFVLGGTDSRHHRSRRAGVFDGAPPGKPRILLAHEPEQAFDTPHADLQLSGHTHGGQILLPLVRPPGALIMPLPCLRGLCRMRGRPVFVTSGVGTSWFPLRFRVPPEVVLLTLVPG